MSASFNIHARPLGPLTLHRTDPNRTTNNVRIKVRASPFGFCGSAQQNVIQSSLELVRTSNAAVEFIVGRSAHKNRMWVCLGYLMMIELCCFSAEARREFLGVFSERVTWILPQTRMACCLVLTTHTPNVENTTMPKRIDIRTYGIRIEVVGWMGTIEGKRGWQTCRKHLDAVVVTF